MLVHDNSTTFVHLYSCLRQIQSRSIGTTSGSQKNSIRVQLQNLACHGILIDNHHTFHGLHTGIQAESDAFLFQHFLHAGSNVTVFTGYQFGIAFQHCHLRSERSVHRSELQADIPAAYDNKMLRKLRQFHNGSAGVYFRIVLYSPDRRNDGFSSRIDKYLLGLKLNRFFRHTYFHHIRTDKRTCTRIYRYIRIV